MDEQSLIHEPIVKAAMRDALSWSNFGPSGGHEEGAHVLRDAQGELSVVLWQVGERAEINPPFYPDGKIGSKQIVGSFHTHPNTGPGYVQRPSRRDVTVRVLYPQTWGEFFVISQEHIYRVEDDGSVTVIGKTEELLAE